MLKLKLIYVIIIIITIKKRNTPGKFKQAPVDVIAHVVEVRRDGVDATPEVHVVREVDKVVLVVPGQHQPVL